MQRILVTGSVAYDLLLGYDGSFRDALRTDPKDQLSVIYLTSHFAKHHGGTGANIAWHLTLLGGNPLLVSTVGADGGSYIQLLRERGLDVSYIDQISDDVTSTAIIGSDSVEHQIGFFHAGADARGSWPDLAEHRDDLSFAIISPRDERLMLQAIAFCKTFAVPYFFDPGQRITSMNDDDLRRCLDGSHALIANEYEWTTIAERLHLTEESALELTKMVVVTMGERGARAVTDDGICTVGSCMPDCVVNPTGAGDALRAGLLFGLKAQHSLEDSLRLGCALASYVVEIPGTLLDSLDREALNERARTAYGEDLPV